MCTKYLGHGPHLVIHRSKQRNRLNARVKRLSQVHKGFSSVTGDRRISNFKRIRLNASSRESLDSGQRDLARTILPGPQETLGREPALRGNRS